MELNSHSAKRASRKSKELRETLRNFKEHKEFPRISKKTPRNSGLIYRTKGDYKRLKGTPRFIWKTQGDKKGLLALKGTFPEYFLELLETPEESWGI